MPIYVTIITAVYYGYVFYVYERLRTITQAPNHIIDMGLSLRLRKNAYSPLSPAQNAIKRELISVAVYANLLYYRYISLYYLYILLYFIIILSIFISMDISLSIHTLSLFFNSLTCIMLHIVSQVPQSEISGAREENTCFCVNVGFIHCAAVSYDLRKRS